MWKLGIILFIIVGPTLAGIGALIPLAMGGVNQINPMFLAGAAVVGALIAIPVSLFLGKKINDLISSKGGVTA